MVSNYIFCLRRQTRRCSTFETIRNNGLKPSPTYVLTSNRCTSDVDVFNLKMKPGFFELEKPSYVVPEDAGTVRVGVVRKDGSDGEIHMIYQTVGNTAEANQDFIPTAGELIFKEGEVRKDIIINILDDEMRESSETFEFQLLDATPVPGVLNFRRFESKLTTVVTITDNDMMPGIVEIEKPFYNILENVGAVEIGVIRLDGTDGEIKVEYRTENQTARSGKDFEPVQGELIFGEGEKRKTILVPIVDDDQREPTEQFEVYLLNPTPGPGVINFKGLGPTKRTAVSIRDDDMKPGTFEIEQPSYVVPEDAGTLRVGVVRVGGSDGEIHMKYKTVSHTALADQDFIPATGELIFEDGDERKDIVINILDDKMRESSETFEVQLLDPTPAPGVLNFRRFESKVTTVVTIMDNDMKPGRLELEESILDVLEDIGSLKLNVVRLGGSDGQIRTWCKTVPKSARSESDFVPVETELVFEEGEVRKIIEVQILDNHHKEPVRSFEVLLFNPSAAPEVNSFTGLGDKKSTLVNILDDDSK
ncbi:adhesion G-protein coupled receptor V1 [Trichonephila clavipes]|nr:adhesion G-protein coupled receptor V1 [Trichonephila clavipes]